MIIIVIAVVCSVVAVLGILVVLQGINDLQSQEIRKDLDLARAYQTEYDEIMAKTCLPDSFPTSYHDAEIQLAGLKNNVDYFMEQESNLSKLEKNMELLQEKYSNTDIIFVLTEHFCSYDEEQQGYEKAKRIELNDRIDEKSEIRENFVSLQYQKCIEEGTSKFICDTKLGKFTETAKLVYGYN